MLPGPTISIGEPRLILPSGVAVRPGPVNPAALEGGGPKGGSVDGPMSFVPSGGEVRCPLSELKGGGDLSRFGKGRPGSRSRYLCGERVGGPPEPL
jgi:hypothetical protein